jgi:hypothetical protein
MTKSSSNAATIASLPPGTTRVQVTDEFGKTRYKKPSEIADNDVILRNSNGDPIVMTGRPGRKKKPDMQPANAAVAEQLRAKEMFVEEDELLETIRQNPEGSAVLDFVMQGLAEEAASLGFERAEAERKGESTSQISMRRINAYKAVGESWIKRKEQLANGGVDMESPAFKRLFQFIMDTFREALEEDVKARPEMIETIFTSFSRRLDDDWTREATKRMSDG